MGQLTITTFLSLDGVMQAPGGPNEDTSSGFTHGGWMFPLADEVFGGIVAGNFSKADAFLLGRGTYDIFAAHWPRVTDADDPIASRLNTLPKHVASRSRTVFDWLPSTPVRDAAAEVGALKRRYAGELQVHGSPGLAQTLIEHGLIDEYRLFICPVILGGGKRLFCGGAAAASLALVHSQTSSTGVVYCVYRPAGPLKTGSFALD